MTDKKKPLEFSQKWLIGCGIATVGAVLLSFLFSALQLNALESLSSTVVTVFGSIAGASVVAYGTQNSVRAYSADKYGISTNKSESTEEDSEETPVDLCAK